MVELNGGGLSSVGSRNCNRTFAFSRSTVSASAQSAQEGGVTIVHGRTPIRQSSANASSTQKKIFVKLQSLRCSMIVLRELLVLPETLAYKSLGCSIVVPLGMPFC